MRRPGFIAISADLFLGLSAVVLVIAVLGQFGPERSPRGSDAPLGGDAIYATREGVQVWRGQRISRLGMAEITPLTLAGVSPDLALLVGPGGEDAAFLTQYALAGVGISQIRTYWLPIDCGAPVWRAEGPTCSYD